MRFFAVPAASEAVAFARCRQTNHFIHRSYPMRDYTRREFLGTAAAASAVLIAGSTGVLAATRRKIPIGVQLYSVRTVFQRDIPGTLAGVKKIGFEGVEFAGYFSYANDAKGLRKLLDDNGLKCCGTHIGLQTMQGDALAKTIEFNQILGNDKLVVPSGPRATTIEQWAQFGESFNAVAEKLKEHKLRIGYHNHAAEFTRIGDQMPADAFFGKASADVFMQLDIGHCVRAGADPVAYLKKYTGRVLTVHTKDFRAGAPADDVVGAGLVKWPEVLDACDGAGVQWHIIEEESNAFQGLDGIEKSFQGLKKLLG
jgi:sugar phosphate isomerase/epimerase